MENKLVDSGRDDLPDVHQRKSDEVSPDTIEVSSFNKFN
jgi:hypothetical protein